MLGKYIIFLNNKAVIWVDTYDKAWNTAMELSRSTRETVTIKTAISKAGEQK